MTDLEHWRGLHLQDLRGGCGRLSRAFLDGLKDAAAKGMLGVWIQARREAGVQHSEEVLKWEDERHAATHPQETTQP